MICARSVVRRMTALGSILVTANSASAQEAAAGTEGTHSRLRETFEHTIIAVKDLFERPLHPVVSGVAPNGGIGAGVGYETPDRPGWGTSARAVHTVHNYWLTQGTVGFEHRRGQFRAFGRAREMGRLDYYGSGPSTSLSDRTSYSYRDPAVGADGHYRATPWLTLGGRVEHIWPYARAGERPPSIEQRFFPDDAPGLFTQPRFGRYQGSIDVRIPGAVGDAFYQGTRARATYAVFDDRTLDQFTFSRLDVEAQQVFAGFGAYHRLTLSGWMSTTITDEGQTVPFYFQNTLGGRSEMRGLHEDRLGSDGTDATLRGFRSLRFRDRNLLLLQAEYRLPVWGLLEATVFGDAGKVAPTRSDLDLSDLRRDFGFSVSVMESWRTMARVDVAFGSGERAQVFFSVGRLTP